MSSAQAEFQKLVYETLLADTAVMALVDGIYDKVPANAFGPKNAYIRFGPSAVTDDDSECIIAGDHALQLDCFSRAPGTVHCKKIVDAVKAALHERDLEMVDDNALVEIRVPFRQVFPDPDELTMHGVVRVEGMIEEWP